MKVQSADVQSGWIKLSHWQILMLLSFGRKIGLPIICTTSVYLADYPQTCCNRFRNGHRIFIERMYADLGPNTQLFQRFLLCSLILETFNMVNVTVVKNQVAKTNYFFVGSAQVVYIYVIVWILRGGTKLVGGMRERLLYGRKKNPQLYSLVVLSLVIAMLIASVFAGIGRNWTKFPLPCLSQLRCLAITPALFVSCRVDVPRSFLSLPALISI